MNRALQLLLGGMLLCGSSTYAQDIELPASHLTVENVVPLSELSPNGGPRTLRAVDPLAIYSNVTNFLGQAYPNGGSTASITRMVADNVTFTTYPGVSNVTTFRFAVANLNATTQSVRARVRFYDSTGASLGAGLPNGPGAYVTGYSFNAFSFSPGVTALTASGLVPGIIVPAGATTTYWAAITFDNVGTTTGATNTELNNFGTGLFDPVDLGSSTDVMFQTTAAGSFLVNNPAGGPIAFAGAPVANNGWEFVVTSLGTPVADLTLALTDTPDPVIAGNSITYVATSTNNGPNPAPDLSITLPLPAGTTFTSATPDAGGVCSGVAVGANGTLTCSWAGDTASAAARSVSVVVGVPVSTANGASLTLNASTASLGTDPVPANNDASVTTAVITNADLSITLTDSPDPVVAGTNLTYLATLTNGGPSDAQDVSITLPLPAGTSFVSVTPSAGGACNAATPVVCTWAGATVPTGVVSATIVAAVAPATTGVLSATATAASNTTDPTTGDNTATATTTVNASADLSITLADAPDPVSAGTNLVYTATVTNAGPSDAIGVSVTLPVPANTTFVSGSTTGGGSCSGSPIVCTFPTSFAPTIAQTATITVAVAASTPDGSSISATATVASSSTDPNAANNSATATTAVVANANLQLTLSASALEAETNEPVTFTAVSLNLGPSDAQNLSITLTLTPDFRYSAHTATGATCTTPQVGTTGAISCTWAGATAPNVSRTLAVVAFSNNQGATAVNASTVSDTSDPVTANNVGNVSVQVGFAVEGIPALNPYGLILLGLMLGLLGFVAVRRNS
jgi:uncharacterized repeat protein (TIGR01451 family)